MVAHVLAKKSLTSEEMLVWLEEVPTGSFVTDDATD